MVVWWILIGIGMGVGVIGGAASPPVRKPSLYDAQTESPSGGKLAPSSEQDSQLETCREGMLDVRSRPEERRRWADLLLSYDTPSTDQLIVALLSIPDRPEVQRTVCAAITDRGRIHPERMRTSFVEPLVSLLGSDNEDLRNAASAALAGFAEDEVAARLDSIASQNELPLAKRLAAIDALSANTHRRPVVGRLIRLLDQDSPEIAARVTEALDTLSQRPIGGDKAAWKAWWEGQSRMGEEAWLAEQLRVYRAAERRLAAEFQAFRAETDRDAAATTARLRDFQRDVLRTLTPEQREVKLVEWLDDPLTLVKMGALSIVKSRIADEGKRPEGDVLAALLRMVRGAPAALRREALQIVQNLNDASVVETVVARLSEEKDPVNRVAVLQAIGKLGDPAAVPALVAEIRDTTNRIEFLREAALAISQIAVKPESREALRSAVEPLKGRYEAAPSDQPALRAALLSAMAGVADPSFASEFQAALESDDAALLQPAVRGVATLGDASKKARIRTLVSHSDPRVRLVATEALAKLDREESAVEPLLVRLNPAIESNELVRDAAWRAYRELASQRPVRDRIRAAERLRELPDLETKYLAELIASLAGSDGNALELDELRDRLATTLVATGKHAEALPYLRDLYEAAARRGRPDAPAIGIRWLEAALLSPTHQGVGAIVTRLSEAGSDEAQKAKVVDTVARFLDSADAAADTERTRRLIVDLGSVSTDLLGERWTLVLAEGLARIEESNERAAKSRG